MPIVCNYSLIRIVPNRATGEFANVGVVLSCPQERFFGFRLEEKSRYDRLLRFFPNLRSEAFFKGLEKLETELADYVAEWAIKSVGPRNAEDEERLKVLMRHLARPREALIQYGPISTSLAEDPREELNQIFQRNVGPNFGLRINEGRFPADPVTQLDARAQARENQVRNKTSPRAESIKGEETPAAIAPVYTTPVANSALELHQGPAILEHEGNKLYCEATVKYEWLPTPGINFHISESGAQAGHLSKLGLGNDVSNISLLGADSSISITNSNLNWGPDGQSVSIDGFLSEGLEIGHGEDLQYVVFHLVNFIPLLHLPIYYEKGHSALARAEADFDGWHLTIDGVGNFRKLEEDLKSTRGSGITHAIRLERLDGAAFDSKQAQEIQSALFWFFSFTRGFASPPILPVGFDSCGDRVWESWHAMRSTPWRGSSGWLSDRQYVSRSLQKALRGFWQRWNDPLWNAPDTSNIPLIRAIHWFISANTDAGGIEGSIILAETGLELMAWVVLVEGEKIYGQEEFKALSSDEKLRKLLGHLGMGTDIPTDLTHLKTLAANRGWQDGPSAISEFRDGTMYPDLRANNNEIAFRETYEILQLALWYLELSILHVLGYSGYYVNRTRLGGFAGDTELVPWAKAEIMQAA